MRKKLLKIVLHIVGVILFIFVTAYALLAAYGYQIDLLNQNIVKTSIIDISSKLKNAEIYVDNELVSKKAPFQVKNIKPGIHFIDIYKNGFTKWSKKIEVIEDLVTKVDDVLLLPFDFGPYLTNIDLDFQYDDYLITDDHIIFINHTTNEILVYKLVNNELKQTGKFNIVLKNKQINIIDHAHIGLNDKNNLIVINLAENSTQEIKIPNGFNDFIIVYTPDLTGYYLNSGSIYKADISDKSTLIGIALLKENQNCLNKFDVISSYDHVLIQCDDLLYDVNNDQAELIDSNVKLTSEISNNSGKIIYFKNTGELIKFNIFDKTKKLLARFIDDINFIKWHNSSKYIFMGKNNNLLICDLDFSNCNKFFDKNIYLNKTKPEYLYINNGTLAIYNLESIF